MQLTADISSFLASPVTIILGTRGEGFTPDIARGVGLAVLPDAGTVDIMVSRWQWPVAVANLQANGALAMTVSAPQTYQTYQLKGQATVHPASDADIALAARYVRRMLDVFAEFDMTAAFSGNWMSLRDLMVARLTVAEIFIQTPGPQAGQMAGTVR